MRKMRKIKNLDMNKVRGGSKGDLSVRKRTLSRISNDLRVVPTGGEDRVVRYSTENMGGYTDKR